MQIEKLINIAEEFKIATLKAYEYGIKGYVKNLDEDIFLINKEGFKRLSVGRDYIVKVFGSCYKYEYQIKSEGVIFYLLTDEFLFDDDENKLESE